ncbi:MAG TPA: TIGR03915 family putative DNA repair protein, partial [Clostridia bacterium]|nr:TIGR03915 family putative DNA repair protein [Clostridia bacterium]
YTCVFEAVYLRQMPVDILAETEAQGGLIPEKWVATDNQRALRVREGIARNISPRALELTETVFLSCMPHREMALLRFLLLGFQEGARVLERLSHPEVAPLLKAEGHLLGEKHLLLGFVRFAENEGKLFATISPKNFVLPLMAGHFADRFTQETFMIYDQTHGAALIHEGGQARCELVKVEAFEAPEPDERELRFQALWKQFYKTIGIAERNNPRCRMGHMPKRYWVHMTEMKELL